MSRLRLTATVLSLALCASIWGSPAGAATMPAERDDPATVTAPTPTPTPQLEAEPEAATVPYLNNRFVDIKAGYETTCGIRGNGLVACWPDRINPPRFTQFDQIDTSGQGGCGITVAGKLSCWGLSEFGGAPFTPPGGTFTSVSMGIEHGCGLRANKTIACWGDDYQGQATPPAGTFDKISVGASHGCGLKANGTVVCWGDESWGALDVPAATFVDVAAAYLYSCGIRTDGATVCWGRNNRSQFAPAGIDIETIAAADYESMCGLTAFDRPRCWGNSYLVSQTPTTTELASVSVGANSSGGTYACGLTPAGTPLCWGSDEGSDLYQPPTTPRWFTDVGGSSLFFEDIGWLSDNDISDGQGDGTFGPTQPVSRQAMAAFLWRIAGAPEPPASTPHFLDVPPGHPFADPIRWLVAEGITTGYGDGRFQPNLPVSRQAMAAFLWRLAGEPTPSWTGSFSDVPVGADFRRPIRWLAGADISGGYPDGTFRPTLPVSRQSMAAFLRNYVTR